MALDQPLDEQFYFSPGYFESSGWGSLHSNSVLWYFQESPFFDVMSNNMILLQQLRYNEKLVHVLYNRELFEARLKAMSGLEFIVAEQPADPGPAGTGVWVIRKQIRKKRQGEEDEVTVLNTYHIVGDRIYMAPVVADMLKTKMVSLEKLGAEYSSNLSSTVKYHLQITQLHVHRREPTRLLTRSGP
jgi:mediator of RNA polymerase II transcription subunit 6